MTTGLFNVNGADLNISATTTTASGAITMPNATSVRVLNLASATAYIRSGSSGVTATVNDTPVVPNVPESFSLNTGDTHLAVILASGTGTVNFLFGVGAE
jgi:hypothetical protein